MKRIWLILMGCFFGITLFAQSTPLSTILTWYETGDKPTQAQFEAAWRNSYNAVSDGMWDLTGYPSIGFAPFSSMQVGKFSQVAGFPTDSTTALNFNGTLKVSNLWVNGQKWSGGGGSGWTLAGANIYPTNPATNVAIGTTSASGFDLYILGTTYSTSSIGTSSLNLFNSGTGNGSVSIDAFGNMQFTDEFYPVGVTLSGLLGGGSWIKTGVRLSYVDTVSVGQSPDVADSLFNVYGTMFVEGLSHFRMPITADSGLVTDDYIQTPTINFAYGAKTGGIDLYNALGKLSFTDADYPTGITLAELKNGYWKKSGSNISPTLNTDNVIIGGGIISPMFDLSVGGGSYFGGASAFMADVSMAYGTRIQFTNGYISNGLNGLEFNDLNVGTVTLQQIMGVVSDSFSVSKVNMDTLYFSGSVDKKMVSTTNDIFLQQGTSEFKFNKFIAGAMQKSVFYTDALQMKTAFNDTIQDQVGFEQQGKLYLSKNDTTMKYATGATNEWWTLATEEWTTALFTGSVGTSPLFDTVFFSPYEYMTITPSSSLIKIASTRSSGDTLEFSIGDNTYIGSSKGATLIFRATDIEFNLGGASYLFDGTYFRSPTDTLADQEYVRTHGGGAGGPGIPGGASGTLQYNNSSSFGGFWSYDGTDVTVANATGFKWGATAPYLKGYTADSIVYSGQFQGAKAWATANPVYLQKLFADNASGNLSAYSKVYTGYTDANANNGLAYGVYSHLYSDENFASTGNISYSNAGKFIIQNRGTTTIGGGSPGTTYYDAVYGEVAGTIDSSATPGTYKIAAIYGKNSNAGTAKSWAGYFDGNVKTVGYFEDNVLKTASARTAGKWDRGTDAPNAATRLNYNGNLYVGNLFATTDLRSAVLNTSGGTKTSAYWYTGTDNPTNTTRLNYDGNLFATRYDAIGTTGIGMFGFATSGQGVVGAATTGIGISGSSESGYLAKFEHGVNVTRSGHMVYIYKATTGTANNTSNMLYLEDNPTTSGTVSGSMIKGQVVATTRIDMNPRVANGSTAIAYLFDTQNGLTGNAKFFKIGNQGVDEFYVKNDTTVATANMKYRGDLYSWKYRALTDTFAMLLYPGGRHDTAQFTMAASKGWEGELEPFDKYYAKAASLKALPLPYPNGTERRKPNAVYMSYQFEFELERLTRYMKDLYDKNAILQKQIEKLKGREARKQRDHKFLGIFKKA